VPALSQRQILIGTIALVFLGMVIAGVVVSSPTTWFLLALVTFTILVIASAPFIL